MISRPPPDIAPGALFRAVVRAESSLRFRLSVAPEDPLLVRAPSMMLAASALADGVDPLTLLPHVLHGSQGPVFTSAEEAGLLSEPDAAELWSHVWKALQVCAPVFYQDAWYEVLKKGAQAPENRSIALRLGRCVDIGWRVGLPRPDLFYGKSIAELSDGQYLAWMVCADEFKRSLQ